MDIAAKTGVQSLLWRLLHTKASFGLLSIERIFMTIDVELLVDAHANVGEGPIWDEQKQVLYWVDIMK